jgi:dephospho-CoA kinase
MLKIGITGGIGSGKSTVCKVFEVLGIPVYYADAEAKKILETEEVKKELQKLFGSSILNANGEVNRKSVGNLVFNDPQKLAALNSIVHPAVGKHFEKWVSEQQQVPYVIKEAAILFESDAYKQVDKVITINAPLELRIERTMKRDLISREEVLARMKNQWTDEERAAKADIVLENAEKELLIPQILDTHKLLERNK